MLKNVEIDFNGTERGSQYDDSNILIQFTAFLKATDEKKNVIRNCFPCEIVMNEEKFKQFEEDCSSYVEDCCPELFDFIGENTDYGKSKDNTTNGSVMNFKEAVYRLIFNTVWDFFPDWDKEQELFEEACKQAIMNYMVENFF